MSQSRDRRILSFGLLLAAGVSALLAVPGCDGPVSQRSEAELRRSMLEALRQEVDSLGARGVRRTTERADSTADLEIRPENLEEIDRVYNPERYFTERGEDPTLRVSGLLDEDLLGRPQQTVAVGLRRAIGSALARNLSGQEATLGPAISEARVVAAEAAFDWVFFSDFAWQDRDMEQAAPEFIGGMGATMNSDQSVSSATGLRRSLVTGGEFSVQNELIYTDVRQSGFGGRPTPNPSSSVALTFQIDQPLLRGFGADVGLAEVRLARNAERDAVARLKSRLIGVVSETELAYWDLLRAHRELIIASKLLERGIEVREDIKARRVLDAVQAQVADAVATVESRKSDVLRAQRSLRRAGDRLKLLMNDPELPVGSELMLIPSDMAIDEPVSFSLVDEIETAVSKRPEIDSALLAIDDASIRQVVAQSGTLPRLDLRARAALMGFDENTGDAYGELGRGEFIDEFLIGVFYEQPIGNRAPEAELRRRRLERMQSVIAYRRVVQAVVLDVKIALDDLVTNHRLIEQARASRIAAAEALRTLLVEKELTDRGYTVERLSLELNQQASLAAAERAEIQALIDYNSAIARLHEATGTALERNRINFVVPDANQIERGERASEMNRRRGGRGGPG